MDWTQVLAIIVSNVGIFLWSRSESKSDYRQLEASTNAILEGMRADMRDFHGRLCAIEERRRGN